MNRSQRRRAARGKAPVGARKGPAAPPAEIQFQLDDAERAAVAGDADGAARLCRTILEAHPRQPHALVLLGVVEDRRGRHEDALCAFDEAIRAAPRMAEAHLNRGGTLKRLGRLEDAEGALAEAYRLRPQAAETAEALGRFYVETDRPEDAVALFEIVVAVQPNRAAGHDLLTVALGKCGRNRDALASIRAACRLDPAERRYVHMEHSILSRIIPAWHFPMVNEAERNAAYRAAIDAGVQPGMHVLEIGTGSGLLAMMAIRAGAARVTTCEMVPELAERARAVIAANGMSDRITVFDRKSTTLTVGSDLPERADFLVSEILSEDLVSEGVRASVAHARRELLKPGARMIPETGAVIGALISRAGIGPWLHLGTVDGFDLTPFNVVAPRKVRLPVGGVDLEFLSDPAPLLSYDFRAPHPPASAARTTLTATAAGTTIGVVQWIRVGLFDDVTYENPPSFGAAHWRPIVYCFDEPVDVAAGDRLTVSVQSSEMDLTVDLVGR